MSSDSDNISVIDLDRTPSPVTRKRTSDDMQKDNVTDDEFRSSDSTPEKTDYAKRKRLLFSMSERDLAEAGTSGQASLASPNIIPDDYDELCGIKNYISNSQQPDALPFHFDEEECTDGELLKALLSSEVSGDSDCEDFCFGDPDDAVEEEDAPDIPDARRNDWSQNNPGQGRPAFKNQYSGIKDENFSGEDPIDFFFFLFTPAFMQIIVAKTNDHARKLIGEIRNPQSRMTRWKDVTIPEFKIFLGILFHMGSIKMPSLADYWKKHYLYASKIFSNFMSRNRFLLILRTLHFEEPNSTGKLRKISPVIDFFNRRMAEAYYPGEHLSIDESLILWKGRLSFKQYMKSKGVQYGIKLYIAAESTGLVLKIVVYSGSGDEEVGGRDHVKKVVRKLVEDFKEKGHRLFMDNFYNSVDLVQELMESDIYCTGSLRKNRKGNPPSVINKKLNKGESYTEFNSKGVAVTKYNDRREVFLISSEIGNETIIKTGRAGNEINQPKVVADYNKYMGGVDLNDQMMSYNHFERKTLRWYKKVAVRIFEQFLVNAHHLYNKYKNRSMSLIDFKNNIVENLLPNPHSQPPKVASSHIHLPQECPKIGRVMRRRCKNCWQKHKIRKMSSFMCPDCPNKPGICLKCFREFHNYP